MLEKPYKMKNATILLLVLAILTSCTSSIKLIENGNYDKAIHTLVKKLSGKKNKKTDNVKNLELAFRKAQEKDLVTEMELLSMSSESKWEKIYTLYQRIENRQNKIKPLLPLVSKENYQAGFEFINTLDRKSESREKTVEYLYNSGKQLLEDLKLSRNKHDARRAYDFFNRIEEFIPQYKDVKQLKLKAHELGTEYILVSMKNNTSRILPYQLEDDLLNLSVTELNSYWKKYDMRKNNKIEYDYFINMNLQNLDFSPEREKSRVFEDRFEETVKEEKKDAKGKVIRDSLGNIQYVEKIFIYESQIEETHQSKSAIIGGKLEWYNTKTKNVDQSEPLNVEINFNNRFGRLLKGDRDHMSKENKDILRGRPMPFPSNEAMTLEAGDRLKEIIKDYIKRRS